MRRFEELTYYERLEVPVDATALEIRQAYHNALSIYGDDSLIGHAFFGKEEREKILMRIEEAFSTLIDDEKRDQYNQLLVEQKVVDPSFLAKKRAKVATPIFTGRGPQGKALSGSIRKSIHDKDLKTVLDDILSKEAISGKDLTRLRTAAGIRLEDVFEVTRISLATLRAIENDLVEALPPPVYLRNFLKAYAELFRADPEKISSGYFKHLERIKTPSGSFPPGDSHHPVPTSPG